MIELPLDVWHKIIVEYLHCDKKILHSLALVSASISELALDLLWREQSSLKPFYDVVNSSSLSRHPHRRILVEEGGEKDTWGWWLVEPSLVLLEPINDNVSSRVGRYLPRIRNLKVELGTPWYSSMLPILAACTESRTPLLPNLKHLHLFYPAADRSLNVRSLIPLLSPSLCNISISIVGSSSFRPRGVSAFFNLLNVLEREIEQMRYTGPNHADIFSSLGSLTTMRSLTILHVKNVNRCAPVGSAIKCLAKLTSLNHLELDLDIFLFEETDTGPFPLRTHLPALESFRLEGTARALHDFLRLVKSSSARQTTLAFYGTGGPDVPYKGCFEQLYSSSPLTRELYLELRGTKGSSCLTYQHLTPLLQMQIERFFLLQLFEAGSYNLKAGDICSLVQAWPRLADFSLMSAPVAYNAKALIAFSQLSSLEHLDLYLDLRPLFTFPADLGMGSSFRSLNGSCPLEKLIIDFTSHYPRNAEQTEALVANLRYLFPRLKLVSLGGYDARSIQEQLDVLRALQGQ